MRYEIASRAIRNSPTGPHRTMAPFSYTQHHYPILPCQFQAPGRLRCLKQSDRVKSFPCTALGRLLPTFGVHAPFWRSPVCSYTYLEMGRELQKWAEPPKWGGVSSRKDFHHWLWLQPIVIDLHFKITLYKLNIVSSLSKIKYAI